MADGDAQSDPLAGPLGAGPLDDGVDALFSANVPMTDEAPEEPEGLPQSRRPLAEMRRAPVDIEETTPIFQEIASAWFASQRPVPVDWELGRRPGADGETELAEAAPTALDGPNPPFDTAWAAPDVPAPVPVWAPPAQAFASVADEGWRAASGAAAERPN